MITVEEAKLHGNIEHCDDDVLLDGLIKSATAMVEKHTGLLMTQGTVVETFDGFSSVITLRYAPVASVTSVQYDDINDATQTVATSVYRVDLRNNYAEISEQYGQTWPSTNAKAENVTVTYVAGYDTDEVPAALKTAALMLVASMYEQRENHLIGTSITAVPIGAEFLMNPYRVFGQY